MYCKNCGYKLPEDATVCSECNAKLENKNQVSNNNKKNGLKTASIVLGIISLVGVLTVLLSPISFILAIIGLILGICALKKGKNTPGIVLNSIGLFISLIVTIFSIFGIKYIFENVINDFVEQDGDEISNQDYDFSSINLDALYASDVPISFVIDKVDKIILSELYTEDEELIEAVYEEAENYYTVYNEYYDYTKEEFLSKNGFKNEQEFIDYLKLAYKRNKYYTEYVTALITEEEIKEYYDEEVYGDVDTKHILVKVSDSATDDEKWTAKNLAYTIITELNSGASFDEMKEKYKNYITYEELGYKAYNAPLEYTYMKEMKDLEVGKYSSQPVETSYGYHIVYKIAQKEKPTLEKARTTIIEILVSQKQNEDAMLYLEALDYLREEAGFTFEGTVYESEYQEYIKMYLY